MTADLNLQITERAYHLRESEGRPNGNALDHWLQAEKELEAVAPPRPAAAAPGKTKQGRRQAR